ncbi:unnamed protein product [Larinioides sclopetarius]|uniref:Uncharacterized protein n=1 Tax=Larinioides sclopetarius TaxID=280406 RepID=A0AAV2AKP4_9ARAC
MQIKMEIYILCFRPVVCKPWVHGREWKEFLVSCYIQSTFKCHSRVSQESMQIKMEIYILCFRPVVCKQWV